MEGSKPIPRPAGWQAVRRYPLNTTGRDFVVGDIHGAYRLVVAAMRAVAFNPAHDRLFAVGDLVDRGPESIRASRFLQYPPVKAVAGNHEDAWLSMFADCDGEPPDELVEIVSRMMRLKGDWWFTTPREERLALIEQFRELPLAIEVETERGLVGLVHAEVPRGMSWQEFTDALRSGDPKVVAAAQWGRKRIRAGRDADGDAPIGVEGIDRVFVGHTPVDSPQRLGNVYYVDTGAIYGQLDHPDGGRLTLASLTARTGALADVHEAHRAAAALEAAVSAGGSRPEGRDAALLDLRVQEAAPGQPFGRYARDRG